MNADASASMCKHRESDYLSDRKVSSALQRRHIFFFLLSICFSSRMQLQWRGLAPQSGYKWVGISPRGLRHDSHLGVDGIVTSNGRLNRASGGNAPEVFHSHHRCGMNRVDSHGGTYEVRGCGPMLSSRVQLAKMKNRLGSSGQWQGLTA